MGEVDAEALKQRILGEHPPKEWYPLGEQEILGLIDAKERAQERLEQTDKVIREVKEDNEQLRRTLAWWDQHLPGCAKWVHVTERVGSLDVCNGEDVLDEDKACSCGYDERWVIPESPPDELQTTPLAVARTALIAIAHGEYTRKQAVEVALEALEQMRLLSSVEEAKAVEREQTGSEGPWT